KYLRTKSRTIWEGTLAVSIWVAVMAPNAMAQSNSPWEEFAHTLSITFTGPIARYLSLVAVVISGLTLAFSEGHDKRMFAGLLFGVSTAVSAVSILSWLFGV